MRNLSCHLLLGAALTAALWGRAAAVEPEGFFLTVGGTDGKEADGKIREAEFGTINFSRDGETWENVFKGGAVKDRFNHARNNLLRCLTYGDGVFVAAGNSGLLYSKDGRSWQESKAPHGAFSVAFGGGKFVAPSAGELLVSTDGVTWKKVEPKLNTPVWGPQGAGHVRKTVFGNGVFVCAGDQRVSVTRDGETWLHHELLPEGKRPGQFNLAFGAGRFVWVSEKIPPRTSTDGVKWEPLTFPDAEKHKPGFTVLWTGSEFLVDGHGCLYHSTDGLRWTTTPASYPRMETTGKGVFLRGNWPKGLGLSRDEGKTWKAIAPDLSARKIYYFDGKQVIGTNGG